MMREIFAKDNEIKGLKEENKKLKAAQRLCVDALNNRLGSLELENKMCKPIPEILPCPFCKSIRVSTEANKIDGIIDYLGCTATYKGAQLEGRSDQNESME